MTLPHSQDKRALPLPLKVKRHLGKHWKIPDVYFQAQRKLWSGAIVFDPIPGDEAWKGGFS